MRFGKAVLAVLVAMSWATDVEAQITFVDRVHGEHIGVVDDFVVQRNDGTASYNLATVIDDHDLGVGEVIRGRDLLDGTPRQIWLRSILELPPVGHAHVPLMVTTDGDRLSKRDGAVTLSELASIGFGPEEIRAALLVSLDLCAPSGPFDLERLAVEFDPKSVPVSDTVWTGELLGPAAMLQNASSDSV